MSLEDPVIILEDIMVIIIIIMEDQEELLVVIIVEKEVHNFNGMAAVLQVLIPSQTTIMEEVRIKDPNTRGWLTHEIDCFYHTAQIYDGTTNMI